MALGKRKKPKQQPLWIAHSDLAPKGGHPFYTRLNRLLDDDGFDAWLERECAPYFSEIGRPSIPPGVYFRMLFVGYLEGFQSERAIAWHCCDRMSLREFLGYQLHEKTPDHSSFTVWRRRLPLEFYTAVFQRILCIVHRHGLVDTYATGVDSTTLEANASLRRLARKDTGATYREYVKELMREAGEDPTDPAAVVRFDKKRKGKKLSNREWQSETDPDSRIARMKDGTTHLAYKSEHAVDLATGAMLGVKVYPADQGDTASVEDTLETAEDNLATLGDEPPELLCVVTDKGYHQAELIRNLNTDKGLTTYIPERRSKQRRRWQGDEEACREFHGNRRRTKGNEGKRLGRLRSELVERSFALFKRSGNLGRLTLRGLENVNKRYLIHAAAYNLGLVMRAIFGQGTPKGMADALGRLIFGLLNLLVTIFAPPELQDRSKQPVNLRLPRLFTPPCLRLIF
jgi:IS5 family transposase